MNMYDKALKALERAASAPTWWGHQTTHASTSMYGLTT